MPFAGQLSSQTISIRLSGRQIAGAGLDVADLSRFRRPSLSTARTADRAAYWLGYTEYVEVWRSSRKPAGWAEGHVCRTT
jgi:hypothetical protein